MRIILLGAARSIHCKKIANGLAARGHDVAILSLPKHAPDREGLSDAVTLLRLPRDHYVMQQKAVREALQQFRADICYAHYATGYGLMLRESGVHPCVLAIWGSDVYDVPTKSPLHRWMVQRNLRFPDALFSTSHVMARRAKTLVNRPYRVTPFGVDLSRFSPVESGASAVMNATISEERIDKKPLDVGFLKAFYPQYSPLDVLQAFERLNRDEQIRTCFTPHLHLAGDGPQEAELKSWVNAHGLSEVVTFYGRIPHEQAPDFLRRLMIYVSSSTSESFGVSAVEAMACGIPVVVSDVDGFREVTDEGRVAHMVPCRDSEAIYRAMCDIVEQPEKTQRLCAAALERVRERYDWESNLTNIEEGLEAVVSGADEESVAEGGDVE